MHTKKVIVIGAGIAGIAAATALKKASFEVQVLEARGRIGGRMWTQDTWPIPMDMGAFVMHGIEGNPTVELIKKLGLPSKPVDLETIHAVDENGQAMSVPAFRALEDKYTLLVEQASQAAVQDVEDASLAAAFAKIAGADCGLPESFIAWQKRSSAGYYGLDPYELSARFVQQEESFPGGIEVILSGYQPLVTHLSQGLDIHLNTQVQSIDYTNPVVKVTTVDNEVWEADAVIVTVPLGVLKAQTICFTPALPEKKQLAIEHMSMGSLNKVIMQFDSCFWSPDAIRLVSTKVRDLTIPLFVNLMPLFNAPIVVGLVGGADGRKIDHATDEAITEIALTTFSEIVGRQVPAPTRIHITRWGQDPFARGAYSCLKAGVAGSVYDDLAESVHEKLFFAGEATAKPYPGTVHGAYISGMRAALHLATCKTSSPQIISHS